MSFTIINFCVTVCILLVVNVNIAASFTEFDLFVLARNIDYQNAKNLCQRYGMSIVKIEDEISNQIVHNFAIQRNTGPYWIDGIRGPGGIIWVYNDGGEMFYTKWQLGQPDGVGYENCVHGIFNRNGFWNDTNCYGLMTAICYAETSKDYTITIEESQLIAMEQKTDYNSALYLCKQHGMNLVKIQNEESNQAVYNYAMQKKLGEYWIDANDIYTEGLWVSNDGSRNVYNKWYSGQPSGLTSENCVHGGFYKNGFWNDVYCYRSITAICYFEKSISDIESQLVALGQKTDYNSAVNLCQQYGMNMVKIQSEDTNKAVYNYAVQRGLREYWIDGSDFRSEGWWTYNDLNPLVYSKWQPGTPNGWYNENCINGLSYLDGYWNDLYCYSYISVICYSERSFAETVRIGEGQLVALPQKADFNTAINLCKQRGMNLVKIQSEEANQAVYNYAVQKGVGEYWIDANDITTEGLWSYSDGNKIVYNKWYSGEPNGVGFENCLQGLFYKNGYWNDIHCSKKIAVICYQK